MSFAKHFGRVVATGLVAATTALGFAAPAHATSTVNETCSSIGKGYTWPTNHTIILTVTAGEVYSINVGSESSYRYALNGSLVNGATASAKITITSVTGKEFIERNNTGTMSISCSTGATGASGGEELQAGFTPTQILGQASALSGFVSNATSRVAGGTPSVSMNNNGFSLNAAALGGSGDALSFAQGEAPSAWNAWVEGRYTSYDADAFDGDQMELAFGVDYMTGPNTLVGALVGFGRTDFDGDGTTLTGAFDADGTTVGVYGATQTGAGLLIDGMLAYTDLDYETDDGSATAAFGGSRMTLGLSVRGEVEMNGMRIEPTASFVYAKEDQDAYTDSASTAVAANEVTASRLSFGPKVHLAPTVSDGGTMNPWVSIAAEYTATSGDIASTIDGVPDLDEAWSARLGAGFTFDFDAGGQVEGALDIGGLGAGDYSSVGIKLMYVMPF